MKTKKVLRKKGQARPSKAPKFLTFMPKKSIASPGGTRTSNARFRAQRSIHQATDTDDENKYHLRTIYTLDIIFETFAWPCLVHFSKSPYAYQNLHGKWHL